MLKTYKIDISPMGAPRMNQSDKWRMAVANSSKVTSDPRIVLLRRWIAYRDELVLKANVLGLRNLPATVESIRFFLPIPQSRKKKTREGDLYCFSKPDLDNLLKALQDALCGEDSHVAEIRHLGKYYTEKDPYVEIIIDV
jgi:hypothetical protein